MCQEDVPQGAMPNGYRREPSRWVTRIPHASKRFCRKSGLEAKMDANLARHLCREPLELLSERASRIPGILRLPLADHVDHLDAA
jgi:hypothetical protein